MFPSLPPPLIYELLYISHQVNAGAQWESFHMSSRLIRIWFGENISNWRVCVCVYLHTRLYIHAMRVMYKIYVHIHILYIYCWRLNLREKRTHSVRISYPLYEHICVYMLCIYLAHLLSGPLLNMSKYILQHIFSCCGEMECRRVSCAPSNQPSSQPTNQTNTHEL